MSDYVIHEESRGGLTLKILPDDNGRDSPRDWCNVARFAMRHRRYSLGDEGAESELSALLAKNWRGADAIDELEDDPIRFALANFDKLEKAGIVAAVIYMYDHGGITISCSFGGRNPFHCPWDSGIVGIAFVDRATAAKEYGKRQWRAWAKRMIECEVSTYDAYLRGDVAGYQVEDSEGNHLDSCWGFYPDESGRHTCAIDEGRAVLAYHLEKAAKESRDHADKLKSEIRAMLAGLRAMGGVELPTAICLELRAGIMRRLGQWRVAMAESRALAA